MGKRGRNGRSYHCSYSYSYSYSYSPPGLSSVVVVVVR
jgi:hypothetical protein